MVIYLFSVVVALALGALAGWSDFRGMTIPNGYAAGVLVAFFAAFAAAHVSDVNVFLGLAHHLLTGVAVLAVTFGMFAFRLIGGGDSKLITAFSFWVGLQGLAVFLFAMMLAGIASGLFALVIKKARPFKAPAKGTWIERVQSGESVVAYGIPIAIGALAAFYDMNLLAPNTLKLFLMPN